MNFNQAFFELSYLFWVVVALMVCLMLTVGLVARWRNWLSRWRQAIVRRPASVCLCAFRRYFREE